MKKIILVLSTLLLVGCTQQKKTNILADEQIAQICCEEIAAHYNLGITEDQKVTVENLELDWLCDSKGANSYRYKAICQFDIKCADYVIVDNTALVNFSYGTHDRLLLDSEVNTLVKV